MHKIGHQTLFLPTSEHNPRNGESTFARLNDGRIMMAYTEYYGTDWEDHATARISAVYSADEGETWTEPVVIIKKDEHAQNIMSPSLFRMVNGKLGIVYLIKEVTVDNTITCMPIFAESEDEGLTWSDWVYCTTEMGYYCVINDGCMVDRNGRIWVPLSYCGVSHDAFGGTGFKFGKYKSPVVQFAISDDCGRTWTKLPYTIESPLSDSVGLAEPGIYEYEDGRLWMYCRTGYGYQYQSFSEDRGLSWSSVQPNFAFTSPDSPMRVRRVGDYTAAVFNPYSFNCLRTVGEVWRSPKRTPLVCAISRDDGRSFDTTGKTHANGKLHNFAAHCYLLEDDENDSYCYPGVIEVADGFLVTYYHSNGTEVCLNSTKVVKVLWEEIEQ